MRDSRDPAKYQAALEAITEACESGEGNLLHLSMEAAKARATVGEITDAMEKVAGVIVCFNSRGYVFTGMLKHLDFAAHGRSSRY